MVLFVLRKTGEEPIEGIVMATYVPRDLFTDFSDFSSYEQSLSSLEKLIIKFNKRAPQRYKGIRKRENQEVMLVYDKSMDGSMKSNSISITGKLIGGVAVEPGRERVYAVKIEVGFAYANFTQIKTLLDAFDRDFVLVSDHKFQPDIKIERAEDDELFYGNFALFKAYNCETKEATVATVEGETIRKKSYIIAMH